MGMIFNWSTYHCFNAYVLIVGDDDDYTSKPAHIYISIIMGLAENV